MRTGTPLAFWTALAPLAGTQDVGVSRTPVVKMSPKRRAGPPAVPNGVILRGGLAVRTRKPDGVTVPTRLEAQVWSSAEVIWSSPVPSHTPTRQSPNLKSRKLPGVGVSAGSTGTLAAAWAPGKPEGAGVGLSLRTNVAAPWSTWNWRPARANLFSIPESSGLTPSSARPTLGSYRMSAVVPSLNVTVSWVLPP